MMHLYGAQNTKRTPSGGKKNSRSNSKKFFINKTERKIKYLWKYSGFSCHNNSHQSKDMVNCVVNILSSLRHGSSKVVDANIELNSTNLQYSFTDCFYFLCLLKSLGPSTGIYSFMRISLKRNKGIVKLL